MTPPAPSGLRLRTGLPDTADVAVVDLDGRSVVRFEVSADNRLEPLSSHTSDTLAAACELAIRKRHPLVAWIASSGPNIREGIPAMHSWAEAARALVSCSGVVPTILVLDGPAVSGSAFLLGIADHVIMVDTSYAFVSGPRMVEEFTALPIDANELGGAPSHFTRSGVASLVVPSADEAGHAVGDLLAYLPDHADSPAPRMHPGRGVAAQREPVPELQDIVPESPTGSYDVRDAARLVVDDDSFFELRAGWAPNLVTALATIDGRTIGVLANQPQAIAGTLNIEASQKGARFVNFCDAFNISLLTFVDTPGFQPGKDLEWRGMIRHGAELAFAYAQATVPRVSVTLRKSYGGAYIVMDSKQMGNDLALAWPSAEIAVMGAKGAVEILHRRSTDEERAQAEIDYEQRLLNPWTAAERGSVDMVIDPADTRWQVAAAFDLLETKSERLVSRRHANTPL